MTPLGDWAQPSEDELDALSQFTDEDFADIAEFWKEHATDAGRNLLDADPADTTDYDTDNARPL